MAEAAPSLPSSNQLLPHDIEAERCVLSCILQDNTTYYQVVERLQGEHFFVPAHKLILEAMSTLADRQEPIDEATLSSLLNNRGFIEQTGGYMYINRLVFYAPSPSNVAAYVQVVHHKHLLRELITVALDISNKGRQPIEDVPGLIQEAESIFLRLSDQSIKRSYTDMKTLFKTVFNQLADAQEKSSGMSGLPTGFVELDKMTDGLQASDLIIMAARPSMGKTSLAINIATHLSLYGKLPVIIFTLEMSKEQLASRLLCSEATVDSQKLRQAKLEERDWEKLARASTKLSKARIFVDETPQITPLIMHSIARRIQAEHGLGLVVVDYLQLMRSHTKTDNREQEIAEISRGLKAIAKNLQVPVLACAQLNRALESRTDKRPRLADLRESGSIEQDADIVLFIYRDEVYNPNTEFQGEAELHIAKHRNGPITTSEHGIRLAFVPQYTKFGNLSRRDEAPSEGYGPPTPPMPNF